MTISNGADGQSATATAEPAGANCATGGVKVQVGSGAPTYVCSGASGADGQSTSVTAEPAGANCATGGVKVQVGTGAATYVCNGANGANGADGQSASLTAEPAGANCASGGVKIQVGTGAPSYVCNGAAGSAGASVTLTPEPAGANCANGGVVLQVGTGAPSYVCAGLNAEVATPVISPAGGTYGGSVTVTLTTATPGASIYYTLDGTAPSAASTLYGGAFAVSSSATVRAVAIAPGRLNSAGASAAYTIITILRVSPTGSDATGDGSAAAPYATPGMAATVAAGLPASTTVQIRVAAGSYGAGALITLANNTSLLGGYTTADWSTSNPAVNVTTLSDTGITGATAGWGSVVALDPSATALAGIDGFTIAPPNPVAATYACVVGQGAGFIKRISCTIHGNANTVAGLFVAGGSPLITGNVLRVDEGPTPNGSMYGISCTGAAPQILGNDVRLLAPYGRYQEGIVVAAVPAAQTAVISSNLVDTGAQASWNGNAGIEANGGGAAAVIANNTVRFGDGPSYAAFGIGESVTGTTSTMAYTVVNNLVWSTQNLANDLCVALSASTTLTSLANNNLFNCPGGLTSGQTAIAGVNGLTGASGNVSFVMTGANTYFVNDASDFHLNPVNLADPNSVMVDRGGLDRGAGNVDLDGRPRTGNGTTGWSLGCYEQDL